MFKRFLFVFLGFKFSGKNTQGSLAILKLTSLGSGTHLNTCGFMDNSYSRFHFVDILSARASRTRKFYLQISRFYFYFCFFANWNYGLRSGRGVYSPPFLSRRYSLNAMHSRFKTKFLVNSLAFDFYSRFFVSTQSADRFIKYPCAPISKVCVENIHTGQFLGKEGRFFPTGTGTHF